MGFGYELYAANGSVRLAMDTVLPRVLWAKAVTKDSTGSEVFAGVSGFGPELISVTLVDRIPHRFYRSGDTLHWEPAVSSGSGLADVRGDSLLMVMFMGNI